MFSKELSKIIPYLNINLPQLSLSTFNSDPWHLQKFWSSFNAAVHSKIISEIQKLNYLISCLKGTALQTERSYGLAPKNYELVR